MYRIFNNNAGYELLFIKENKTKTKVNLVIWIISIKNNMQLFVQMFILLFGVIVLTPFDFLQLCQAFFFFKAEIDFQRHGCLHVTEFWSALRYLYKSVLVRGRSCSALLWTFQVSLGNIWVILHCQMPRPLTSNVEHFVISKTLVIYTLLETISYIRSWQT